MIKNCQRLVSDLFKGLGSYSEYIKENGIATSLETDLGDAPERKSSKPLYYSVTAKLDHAFPPELDDLCRLHFLVRSRKVMTVLEFGLGQSTIVFDLALQRNKLEYSDILLEHVRRCNPFYCYSVENNERWINELTSKHKLDRVEILKSSLQMTKFNDRPVTMYDRLPNCCPDLIYLDGPDQFSVNGSWHGLSTDAEDRMPMAADILLYEHFCLPGTLIVVDGRSANARFLKANLQRDWSYTYCEEFDQHFFEMSEFPLGKFNAKQIDLSLGDDFYERLREFNT